MNQEKEKLHNVQEKTCEQLHSVQSKGMTPRQLAEKYRRQEKLPEHGFVIIYRGEAVGWTNELNADRAREWKRGCMAIPQYRNSPMYIADGEDSTGWGGAARWERMDPKHEPV